MSFLRNGWCVRTGALLGFMNVKISQFDDTDKVSLDSSTAQEMYKTPGLTGKDRLWHMFSVDQFGQMSHELQSVYQSIFLGGFAGLVGGGFFHSRLAYLDFMENNQATAFKSHWEAKKKLQDYVTVNFAKGGFRWAWRLALFTGSYVLVSTSISVYRGKSSVLDYSAAGAVTGAMYKFNLGLRGMAVGGLAGLLIGTIAGCTTMGVLALTGTSMEEMRFWQYKWKQSRYDLERKIAKTFREDSELPLAKHHDEQLQQKNDLGTPPLSQLQDTN